MKANTIVGSMALGPEALKVVGQAFDEAWLEVAGNFGSDPCEIEAARSKRPVRSCPSRAKTAVTFKP